MKDETINKCQFVTKGKKITVYSCAAPRSPVIYLHTFAEEGDAVYQALRDRGCINFRLVSISGLAWNHDMSPWEIPPISRNDTPCTGGADEYVQLLEREIVPKAEEKMQGGILWRGIAGYSLAGLFAVYATYQTNLFSRVASISGSLWFPGIKEYIFSHERKHKAEFMYFSLGNRECKTKNPYLKTVQEQTEEIAAFYQKEGMDTIFQMNPGSHFQNTVERMAAGIQTMLKREDIY